MIYFELDQRWTELARDLLSVPDKYIGHLLRLTLEFRTHWHPPALQPYLQIVELGKQQQVSYRDLRADQRAYVDTASEALREWLTGRVARFEWPPGYDEEEREHVIPIPPKNGLEKLATAEGPPQRITSGKPGKRKLFEGPQWRDARIYAKQHKMRLTRVRWTRDKRGRPINARCEWIAHEDRELPSTYQEAQARGECTLKEM